MAGDGRRDDDRDQDRDRDNEGVSLGVARVSIADGDVYVQRGKSGDRMRALGGMPLLAHDAIGTGLSSRAEVQLGPANFIRLRGESEVRFVDLGNRFYRVEVVKGEATYSELRGGEAEVEIEAQHVTIRPLKRGVYRILVREAGQADLTVRNGEAEVASGVGVQRVKKGRRVAIRAEQPGAKVRTVKADREDTFDKWNERRNSQLEREPLYRAWGWPGFYYDPWYPDYLGFGYGYYGWPGFYGPRTFVTVHAPVVRGGHRGRR
jgi:hypothetical protein